ncbi:MAG TPA: hypothetical protein VKQ36_01775 [Ktedonobacterales bacterium]|nr:hypothetical protein [Ktedonobacterales bacterium]
MMRNSQQLREVFSDFFVRHPQPDGRVRIPLGTSERVADLRGLQNGERVLLVMPGELQAEATVIGEPWHGTTYWYGVLDSIEAIQDITPTPADARPAASAAQS